MCRPRARSHSISWGTSSAAAETSGFEKTPTVLMSGIQQEFLVSFRPQDRTLDNIRSVAHLPRRTLHTTAGEPMEFRFTNNTAPSYLFPAHFKLWFDEYNHFAGRL